jgi:hypothetical protein
VSAPKANPRFIPIPSPRPQDLTLPLDVVLQNPAEEQRIIKSGRLVFHCVGDTGGVNGTQAQEAVAHAMEAQIQSAAEADRPAFFFHLGDVVYYNGLRRLYGVQFYQPYQYYPAPIFAIPGNHDGDTQVWPGDPPDAEKSLAGFLENFCAPQAQHIYPYRETMTQPYPYWTLETPFATVVGLYSNVDGSLDGRGANQQQQWLQGQLASAPADRCLIVAVHHPPFSLDAVHGGSPAILDAIDRASQASGRVPDAVFSGHIHSYQRFTRTAGGRQVPYVVAGAGGYANDARAMHTLQLDAKGKPIPHGKPFQTTHPDVVLAFYEQQNPGFLRVTVDAQHLTGEYFSVPFAGAPPANPVDSFQLDWRAHRLAK